MMKGTRDVIVCTEIVVLDKPVVDIRLSQKADIITGDVKIRIEIDMTVLQFEQHLSQIVEQRIIGKFLMDLRGVFRVNPVPVHLFHIKIGILPVHLLPEILKVLNGIRRDRA
ncbi:MAG: hypothetical protein U5N26_05235 [Candidatus Marinimicrobia bacterium]|nr:hypothetical protein [Candidatus Neomarinimicrobiota bacterium]